jgi:hypothetical protein
MCMCAELSDRLCVYCEMYVEQPDKNSQLPNSICRKKNEKKSAGRLK